MPPSKPHLPEANEFSPGQISLREVLHLAQDHPGDRDALIEAIRSAFFSDAAQKRTDPSERLAQQRTRAGNVLIGMSGYGLFDLRTQTLTDVGEQLLAEPNDATRYRTFARHILRDCHGIEVLDALRDLHLRGVSSIKAPLQIELESRGFELPRATTHHTKMLQWLACAGVVSDDRTRTIDESVVAALTGMSLATLEEWEVLKPAQRAFLRTLRRRGEVHGSDELTAAEAIDLAKYEHGPVFREDQLAAQLFRPLTAAGWISWSGGSRSGRGGKSGTVAPTPKLLAIDLELVPAGDEWGVPADLRRRLQTSLAEIERDLEVSDTHTKGVALELLALRLATDAGLTPLRFRLRAASTGGAEVDLVAEGSHLMFSRWLFQCKNTRTVTLADLAKEVGMAVILRAHVIVLVTTGRFSSSVEGYAAQLARDHHLQVVLIGRPLIDAYRANGQRALAEHLHAQAQAAMRAKRHQVGEGLSTMSG